MYLEINKTVNVITDHGCSYCIFSLCTVNKMYIFFVKVFLSKVLPNILMPLVPFLQRKCKCCITVQLAKYGNVKVQQCGEI